MSASAQVIDCSHPETVCGERLEPGDPEEGSVVPCFNDIAAVVVPAAILSHSDVDHVVGDQGVVGVEWRRPAQVDGAGGEAHDQGFAGWVRDILKD